MVPASGLCTPPRMFMLVDLPEPFSPTRPSAFPDSTEKETSCSTVTPKKLLRMPSIVRKGALAMSALRHDAVSQRIHHRGKQYDAALDDVDGEQRRAEQFHRRVEDDQEEHAEDRPDDLALASEEACAANDYGADDVEEDVLARDRRTGLHARGVHHRRDRGAGAADEEGHQDGALDRNARDARRARVGSDSVDPAAVFGA